MKTTIGIHVEIIFYNCRECGHPLSLDRFSLGLCLDCHPDTGSIYGPRRGRKAPKNDAPAAGGVILLDNPEAVGLSEAQATMYIKQLESNQLSLRGARILYDLTDDQVNYLKANRKA